MHNGKKLTAATLLVAAALLGAACAGSGDQGAAPDRVGRTSEAAQDCNDCGDAWYCDTEGNLAYQESNEDGTCTVTTVITCTSGCEATNDCETADSCLDE
jgi:hypothetical protein